MSFHPTDVRYFDGTAEADIAAKRIHIEHELDEAKRDRRARKNALLDTYRGDAIKQRLLPTIAALTPHERRNYSLTRAIHSLTVAGRHEHCLESEISEGITHDLGHSTKANYAIWIPLRISASGLDTKSGAAGRYLVPGPVGDIIDYLANQTRVISLGAQMITNMRFALAFPVEDTPVTATWVGENPGTDVSESDPVFAYRATHAHTLQSTTSFSREVLTQSSPDLEGWLRRKLASAHALALDAAALHGSGLENQPIGLLNVDGIGDVPVGDNGGAVTDAHIIVLEKAVRDANGDSSTLGFLTNSLQCSKLRAVPRMTGGVENPLWSDNNTLLGHRAEVSNQVRSDLTKGSSSDCSAIVFGSWSSLLLFEFNGAVEIVIDEFRLKKQGMIEITSWGIYDILLQQPAAFAAIQDAR